MLAILVMLTALFAKAQIQLPLVEQEQVKAVAIDTFVVNKKKAAKQAHKRLSKHFLVQQNKVKTSQKNEKWQLHGITKTGSQYFALIKQQAKIVRYQVGNTLLDDSTITAIYDNGISVSTAGKIEKYRLYQ